MNNMPTLLFNRDGSLRDFQRLVKSIYTRSGDRLFSVSDLVAQRSRFTMRALKGIRKGDKDKLKRNLAIAFLWGMAVPNRYELDIEDLVWKRFPQRCSYCGGKPCMCKKVKPAKRIKITYNRAERPRTLKGMQEMLGDIYPPVYRTLEHAGVHLAEEMGEITEAVHALMGEHKKFQLGNIKEEVADFISCIFGVANSAKIDLAKEISVMFSNNCYLCHKGPCVCTISFINKLKT